MHTVFKKLLEINSWNEFFSFANKLNEKGKGDIFEYLTKLILTTKPEYRLILKNVWIQQEGIPKEIREKVNLPTSDEGIDIVAETFTGEFWAIQCKFKGQNQTPTYKELSTFGNLANNYCKNISLALLVHTGEKGVRKRKLLGDNYSEIGLEFWLGLNAEDWERIHKQIKGQSVRPTPKIPRPHQEKAIKSATRHFIKNKASRGRLIMPCATGKSLTAFWIAHALNSKSVIIAVPSLALIKQSLEDWTREFVAHKEEPKPQWLVICSDESTAKLDKDEFVSDAHSMGIPTTTNIEVISSFLTDNHIGRKVIFTTYQSSDKLAQAARSCKFSFDLAILDEAHKTVGIKSKTFATLLSDKNISISKRMFMTATERVMRGSNDEVYSMDDEAIYGGLFHQLTFKEAIQSEPPIICDYKVLTITVTNDEIKQLIAKNKLLTDKEEKLEEQEAQSLASAIALRKATQKYGIKHAISFHRSIKSADDFAKLNTTLNTGSLDNILLNSSHISSKKSAGERARLLNDFTHEQLALMTNARCLTEGVDVPAIDCVLFADPKQSIVDIVQASGRALRPYPGKECGYIMLPLIVPENVSLEEFTESTPFKEVARIIAALSTQDEGIAEEFRITNNGKQNGGKRILFEGTVPVGMKLDLYNFAEKINAKIWERVAKVNWRPFEEAKSFVHELHLKNITEWTKYYQLGDKPADIPTNPDKIYTNLGWTSYGNWLGTGTIAARLKEFRSYNEAKEYVHELNLKSNTEWVKYCQSRDKPDDIPAKPQGTYSRKGWLNWGDWLGTGKVSGGLREYRSFNEARMFVHGLNLQGQDAWRKYAKSENKPIDIPASPANGYKDRGWSGMGDWLGTGTVAPRLRSYLPFNEARVFVHKLRLTSRAEWSKYCKSGNKPNDIPSAVDQIYKNAGWLGLNNWLGIDDIHFTVRKYRSFEDARDFVHGLKIRSIMDWKKYYQSGLKPNDIPSTPQLSYKGRGWKGYVDWLGTSRISHMNRVYRSYNEAKDFVHNLNLKNYNEWNNYCKSQKKPRDIPTSPYKIYLGKGWKGFGDWLGNGTIATINREYRSFEEARNFVQGLKLKNQGDWREYCRSAKKPDNIPTNPHRTYRDKGWDGYGNWLGSGTISPRLKEYRTFSDAREYVHSLRLKTGDDWKAYCKSGLKPYDIPDTPNQIYKSKGWLSMGDWLGTGKIANYLMEFRPFIDARELVHKLNLQSVNDWRSYCLSGDKPSDIPAKPNKTYKDKGWKNWWDWLGKQDTKEMLD